MFRSLCFVAALGFAGGAFAQAAAASIPSPALEAKSYVLLDLNSGQEIVGVNAGERRDPASLTKLMTAYLAFAALREKRITPSQPVKVTERAWRAEGSRMFIEPKRAVSVDELLRGMIVQSGNDAAVALAELVGGSEEAFAAQMNQQAARLGLKGSRFVNATGLSHPEHYSTAQDLAQLAAAIIRDFPEFYPLYAQREYRYNNVTQYNRNRLLWSDPSVDGMKTGFTEAAGYNLVSSAKREGRRLLAVVLGTGSEKSRLAESQKLLNFGFQFYEATRLYEKNQPVATLAVWKGAAREVKGGFNSDVFLTLPRGMRDKLKVSLEKAEPLSAPIAAGQRIGTVKVALEGRPLAEFPLLALEAVELGSWFSRQWDAARLWFR
ncbi:serine-type D-Ala-D-Ala carboxypeptidase (penicillin-binding protein 5/6) [Burkholderiales bacterium]|nr:serine-type D-Ala-D-Ala carboxypeptidase (penicillin-binding protein 5/6) [Burkholderiales bacterium]